MCFLYELAQAKRGACGFSDVTGANDVDDIIYDVTLGNAQHVAQTFQQNAVTFIFLRY